MDVCGGDAYLSVSYNVCFVCVIFATYCLNKKKLFVFVFKYLFTAALLSAMAHSLRESASPPSRLCSVLRFFDVSRVFCFVWCAPSVGEHAELSVCFVLFLFLFTFLLSVYGGGFTLRRTRSDLVRSRIRSSTEAESTPVPCGLLAAAPAEEPAR